jgi:hypothetical protein
MDIESHVRAGFPVVKWPRDAKITPVCASPWAKCGRVDTTFRPAFFISSWMYKKYLQVDKTEQLIHMITIDFLYLIKFYSSWLLDASSSSKGWVGGIFHLCCLEDR